MEVGRKTLSFFVFFILFFIFNHSLVHGVKYMFNFSEMVLEL